MTNKSTRPVVRKAYSRRSVPLGFVKPSKTRQADKQSCDVNHILARYAKDGVLTHVQSSPGLYLDVASIGSADYHTALNTVISAGKRLMLSLLLFASFIVMTLQPS